MPDENEKVYSSSTYFHIFGKTWTKSGMFSDYEILQFKVCTENFIGYKNINVVSYIHLVILRFNFLSRECIFHSKHHRPFF